MVSELLGQGYRIPDDVSVVGFGDFSPATQISPSLTTVKMEGQEGGAVGLRLLPERIEIRAYPQACPPRHDRFTHRRAPFGWSVQGGGSCRSGNAEIGSRSAQCACEVIGLMLLGDGRMLNVGPRYAIAAFTASAPGAVGLYSMPIAPV